MVGTRDAPVLRHPSLGQACTAVDAHVAEGTETVAGVPPKHNRNVPNRHFLCRHPRNAARVGHAHPQRHDVGTDLLQSVLHRPALRSQDLRADNGLGFRGLPGLQRRLIAVAVSTLGRPDRGDLFLVGFRGHNVHRGQRHRQVVGSTQAKQALRRPVPILQIAIDKLEILAHGDVSNLQVGQFSAFHAVAWAQALPAGAFRFRRWLHQHLFCLWRSGEHACSRFPAQSLAGRVEGECRRKERQADQHVLGGCHGNSRSVFEFKSLRLEASKRRGGSCCHSVRRCA
mmetsp:Transcript_3214/g.12884  ORF Transcript_3214/g.12884 Transcript_3214/m.12884 type:complete len:285 (-) Transcript_3214:17-871(-)